MIIMQLAKLATHSHLGFHLIKSISKNKLFLLKSIANLFVLFKFRIEKMKIKISFFDFFKQPNISYYIIEKIQYLVYIIPGKIRD